MLTSAMKTTNLVWVGAALLSSLSPAVWAQSATVFTSGGEVHIIIPQGRPFWSSARSAAWVPPATSVRPVPAPAGAVQITEVTAGIEIIEQVATTTLDITLSNPSNARLEAQMVVPVPDKAALRGFTFQGAASEPKAELLTKEEARRVYDSIVAKTRDPALLEFIGCNLIRSSVFPVEARGTQKVRLVYEHVLAADGDRVDYVLPRTESLDYRVPWKVAVKIKSKSPIGTVYSPSHRLETLRQGEREITVRVAAEASTEPGAFRLSYLIERDGLTASLLAYPDPKVGGGYFLLLAGTPVKAPRPGTGGTAVLQKREVILVLDRSGSMAGEKLEQVRAAALQVLEGLEDGEAFNIIIYHESVESFSPQPVVKNEETMKAARAYIRGMRVRGGTNLHDALVEALRMKPTPGSLPIVLFLTDGLPTVGQTSEKAIREVASKGNPYERRIFTFGVGVDVNTPLLDRIALDTRATSAYVLPKEDVEVKVGQVFKRLVGPVLASPKLQVGEPGGAASRRVHDPLPAKLADLYEGDQLVLLGQYVGEEPLDFNLSGDYFGKHRSFKFHFSLDKATTRNAFVPRLWASRKIAVLVDAIRDLGADTGLGYTGGGYGGGGRAVPANDPRMKELVEEIVRLSKEFGILTEYTAFLAREGTDLGRASEVVMQAQRNFTDRAMNVRTGWGAMNQSYNMNEQRGQRELNARNGFFDENMKRVEVSAIQQMNDRAFYQRGNRWVESSLVDQPAPAKPKVITVGSPEFTELAHRLAAEGRPGIVTLNGEILLRVGGETILVK
jgi:Ca-activated chloride channel homolog